MTGLNNPAPKKLGTLSCMSLITNKMIGTGIFLIPATIFQYTNGSVGLLLLLFLMGTVVIMCGLVIYLEYALNLPFKNGGEKNYLLRTYRYPKGLIGCVYAFQIVLLGFSSGNSYAFGKYVLFAIDAENEALVKLVGVGCITFCILLHIKYPNHGTSLFNFLGMSKILILIMIILVGIFAIPSTNTDNFHDIWSYENNESPSFYSISVAMLEVIYSFKGWENANYVLNEVSDPYHILTIAAPLAVIITSLLYFLVVIAYLIVIPKDEFLRSGVLVAGIFFSKVFGESIASRILPLIISMSNLGNVLVVSFAHGHLNKELADNNYIPYSKWFQNLRNSLLLHWIITVIVLVAPPSTEIYEFIVNLYIYPGTWINVLLTLGLIYLKVNEEKENWGNYHYLEVEGDPDSDAPSNDDFSIGPIRLTRNKPISAPYICIAIFLVANIFLAVFPFIPPPVKGSQIPYWLFPTIGSAVLLSGAGFYYSRKWYSERNGKEVVYIE
ncbi:uncharacterized protein PRCAT00002742001 [Priceomyces carsonii]|uniref:uncharacterized protein n=1 Tax=Priceomyces carsonii TaxID=28549 RepID=UPI002ED95228|nr:unnamed protein product [Priceomyces carsonii]